MFKIQQNVFFLYLFGNFLHVPDAFWLLYLSPILYFPWFIPLPTLSFYSFPIFMTVLFSDLFSLITAISMSNGLDLSIGACWDHQWLHHWKQLSLTSESITSKQFSTAVWPSGPLVHLCPNVEDTFLCILSPMSSICLVFFVLLFFVCFDFWLVDFFFVFFFIRQSDQKPYKVG